MRKFLLLIFLITISVSFFLPLNSIKAAVVCPGTPCPEGEICIENPLCAETFAELLDSVINFVFWLAIAVTPIMIMIAGFYLLTAGGDPKRVETAKKIILWTVIGLAIVLLAKGLISVLEQILGVPTTPSPELPPCIPRPGRPCPL